MLFFLTCRPARHASAEQRDAFDLPGRSLRRAPRSAASRSCTPCAVRVLGGPSTHAKPWPTPALDKTSHG